MSMRVMKTSQILETAVLLRAMLVVATTKPTTSFADTSFADEGHDLGEGVTEVGSAGTVEAPSVDGVQSGDDTETDDELPSRMEETSRKDDNRNKVRSG